MRVLSFALAVGVVMAGSATAQTTPATAAPGATPPPIIRGPAEVQGVTVQAKPAVKTARTERVCKAEPIANSRLKTKRVCVSRAEHERIRNAQKEMVRENLQRGNAQANQNGG